MCKKLTPLKIITFYKFVQLDDFVKLKTPLLAFCNVHKIKGSILLAQEGINATIVGKEEDISKVWDYITRDPRFADMTYKVSFTDEMPFEKMKIRLKDAIVKLGKPEIKPNLNPGKYISPQNWNDIISDPETILLDTRNDYEMRIGSFKNAIKPDIYSFRELPDFIEKNLDPTKNKKVAMFCTGGIRCEKASTYMLEKGFENVYQLHGGILKYLEEVSPEESLWEGDCFVFDDRVAVDHSLKKVPYKVCRCCGHVVKENEIYHAPELPKEAYCLACFEQEKAKIDQGLEANGRQNRYGRHT